MLSELNINSKVKLNNNQSIPVLGLGVWEIPNGKPTEDAIEWAFGAGYRHIDTAKFYKNEASVGKAIKNSPLPRKDIWVTTKLWPSDFFNPRKALEKSLERLGLDYVDLYLIHFPLPGMSNKVWKDMENFADEGLCRSIGVSNYSISQLDKLLASANIPPSINQVRCSPFHYPKNLHEYCKKNAIALEAYSPLTHGKNLDNSTIVELANRYSRSTAQILLRWAIQKDLIVIPKSQDKGRIIENSRIYDFNLTKTDMNLLDSISLEV